jgi:hypothetical protein
MPLPKSDLEAIQDVVSVSVLDSFEGIEKRLMTSAAASLSLFEARLADFEMELDAGLAVLGRDLASLRDVVSE